MPYQQLQFSNEEEEELINLVKENPPLYVPKNRSYKDTECKENIWKKIADELNRSVSDCKIKWKHIRDYYQRQRKEGKKCTGSAAGSERGNKYECLQFLEASFVERQTKTNIPTKKRKRTDVDGEQESQGIQNPLTGGPEGMYQDEQVQLDRKESSQHECQNTQDDPESQKENEYDNNPDREIENNSRRLSTPRLQNVTETISSRSFTTKLTPKTEILKEIQKGRQERLDLLRSFKQNPTSQSSHPIDLFFQSMAAVVKQLPPRLMLQARTKVCNIVGELELEALLENERTNTVPPLLTTWPVPTASTIPQPPSYVYPTHSSSGAITSESPDTLRQEQAYNYSVQAPSHIGDNNIELANYAVLE